MDERERHLRSNLSQLAYEAGFLRGSLSVRERLCGKPGCKCTRGEKHASLYLVLSEAGKSRQVFIPKELESQVRSWVENHRRARDLLDGVCRICLEKVQKREGTDRLPTGASRGDAGQPGRHRQASKPSRTKLD
jgi:hypothetical protein